MIKFAQSKPSAATEIKMNVIQQADVWKGFQDESTYVKTPSIFDKQKMLQYPPIRSAIKMISLPLLAAEPQIAGDEKQSEFLKDWFARCYRSVATIMLWKGISWGYAVGEKVYRPTSVDGKNYLYLTNVIAPNPNDCTYKYNDNLQIDGFTYQSTTIEKDKTALYIYQGDEIGTPYGVSICNDVYWPWRQVMEDWTRWAIWKDFKAVPPQILEYPENLVTNSSGLVVDLNEARAEAKLKSMRTLAGVTLPKHFNETTQEWDLIWNIREMNISDKTTAFVDSINKLESEIFIGALIPKRIIEQDMNVGAYAMLREQAEFFYFILQARLEEWEEYLRRWYIEPMLKINFGNVKCDINLDFGDEKMAWYLEIIKQLAMTGMVDVDTAEIMDRANIPYQTEKDESRVETEAQFQSKKKMTRKEQQHQKHRIAKDFARKQNKELIPLKEKTYMEISDGLRKTQGQMGLRVNRLFKKKWTQNELARAVQIPRSPFGNFMERLEQAYDIGNKIAYDKIRSKHPYIEQSDTIPIEARKQLRLLAMKFNGNDLIGGQPELLEERLFYACMSAEENETLHRFNEAFNNYIDVTLPDNVLNELNIACQLGVRMAIKDTEMQVLKLQKEGKI